jgi:purine-binding chemotaxis protein CheW
MEARQSTEVLPFNGVRREPLDSTLDNIQLACFNLGARLFAVDIMRIREIILPQQLSALPRESRFFDGVITLRGTVIPVMNLRRCFGMPDNRDQRGGKLLIVSLQHRQMMALAVDEVLEVITVPSSAIMPPPGVMDGDEMEYVLGICLHDRQLFMILDIDSLAASADYRETAPGTC